MSAWAVLIWTEMKGWSDAPGPLVYAATDVPQIANGGLPSITLFREHVHSSGFLSSFPSTAFFTAPVSTNRLTNLLRHTHLTETHASTHYDQLSQPLPAISSLELLRKAQAAWMSSEPEAASLHTFHHCADLGLASWVRSSSLWGSNVWL